MKHTIIVKKGMLVLLLAFVSLLSACFAETEISEDLGYMEIPEISIKPGMENHPGNRYQWSYKYLSVVDGKLYIMDDVDRLYVLEQGELKTVFDPPTNYIRIALCGNLAYYLESIAGGTDPIQCYDISSGQVYCITDNSEDAHRGVSIIKDDCLYFRSKSSDGYYILDGMQWSGPYSVSVEYESGEYIFCCTDNTIYKKLGDKLGAVKELPRWNDLIPYRDGLIVKEVFETEDTNRVVLSYLTSDGEWVELMTTESRYVASAWNYYGDTLYYSVVRIGQEEFKGLAPYDNDEQSGTFKIDMNTFEICKISDTYYGGMYIFDDSGIFAVDSYKEIYKLDFDGKETTPVLVRNKADPITWRDLLRTFLPLPEAEDSSQS